MQQLTPAMCANTEEFSISNKTYTFTDTRNSGAYSYNIRKLKDGNCWMVSNLRLQGGTTITNQDSNISAATYTLPASSTTGFNNNAGQFMYNGDSTTGGYYSWLTATANTGVSLTTSGAQASSSVCPKGWRLPTGNASTGEFTILYQAYNHDSAYFDYILSTPTTDG